jgi:hypothetical protein
MKKAAPGLASDTKRPKKKGGRAEDLIDFGGAPHQGTPDYPGGQLAWLEACLKYQMVVIAVGRRVGKTTFVRFLYLREAAVTPGLYQACYMAQNHKRAWAFYDSMLQAWEKIGLVKRHRDQGQDRWIETHSISWGDEPTVNEGAVFHFWSGEPGAHQGTAGEGLNRAVIDEAPLIEEKAWTSTLSPMLTTTRGKGLIIGSPYPDGVGFDWVEREWMKGQPGTKTYDPTYHSFSAPSESNPYNPRDWLKHQRARCMSKAEEACQYDGTFSRDLGAVFENLDSAFVLDYRDEGNIWTHSDPVKTASYVMGIDWGESIDSTVVTIWDIDTCTQVCAARFQKVPYEDQLKTIDMLIRRYEPHVMAEEKEVGRQLVKVLKIRYGDRVTGVVTAASGQWGKAGVITECRRRFQNKTWRFMNIPEQRDEFRLFSRKVLPAGGFRYEAPPGRHDDWVMSTAMASYRLPIADPKPERVVEAAPGAFTPEWMDWARKLNGPRRGYGRRR